MKDVDELFGALRFLFTVIPGTRPKNAWGRYYKAPPTNLTAH